ncbi:MAG: hypothetical protein KF874_11985 [Rhizobiaceae bacterium]|nr:hypothetical protein [Rhizobiaceae bacterium]
MPGNNQNNYYAPYTGKVAEGQPTVRLGSGGLSNYVPEKEYWTSLNGFRVRLDDARDEWADAARNRLVDAGFEIPVGFAMPKLKNQKNFEGYLKQAYSDWDGARGKAFRQGLAQEIEAGPQLRGYFYNDPVIGKGRAVSVEDHPELWAEAARTSLKDPALGTEKFGLKGSADAIIYPEPKGFGSFAEYFFKGVLPLAQNPKQSEADNLWYGPNIPVGVPAPALKNVPEFAVNKDGYYVYLNSAGGRAEWPDAAWRILARNEVRVDLRFPFPKPADYQNFTQYTEAVKDAWLGPKGDDFRFREQAEIPQNPVYTVSYDRVSGTARLRNVMNNPDVWRDAAKLELDRNSMSEQVGDTRGYSAAIDFPDPKNFDTYKDYMLQGVFPQLEKLRPEGFENLRPIRTGLWASLRHFGLIEIETRQDLWQEAARTVLEEKGIGVHAKFGLPDPKDYRYFEDYVNGARNLWASKVGQEFRDNYNEIDKNGPTGFYVKIVDPVSKKTHVVAIADHPELWQRAAMGALLFDEGAKKFGGSQYARMIGYPNPKLYRSYHEYFTKGILPQVNARKQADALERQKVMNGFQDLPELKVPEVLKLPFHGTVQLAGRYDKKEVWAEAARVVLKQNGVEVYAGFGLPNPADYKFFANYVTAARNSWASEAGESFRRNYDKMLMNGPRKALIADGFDRESGQEHFVEIADHPELWQKAAMKELMDPDYGAQKFGGAQYASKIQYPNPKDYDSYYDYFIEGVLPRVNARKQAELLQPKQLKPNQFIVQPQQQLVMQPSAMVGQPAGDMIQPLYGDEFLHASYIPRTGNRQGPLQFHME